MAIILLIAGMAAGLLVGCGGGTDFRDELQASSAEAPPATAAGAAPIVTASVSVADQAGDGRSVVVGDASITGSDGWLIVHREDKGGPGDVVGQAALPEGRSSGIVAAFDAPVAGGAYWIMVHRDAGQKGVYEWPGPDGPIRAVGRSYVQERCVLDLVAPPV